MLSNKEINGNRRDYAELRRSDGFLSTRACGGSEFAKNFADADRVFFLTFGGESHNMKSKRAKQIVGMGLIGQAWVCRVLLELGRPRVRAPTAGQSGVRSHPWRAGSET
jgi:hypothetical protein